MQKMISTITWILVFFLAAISFTLSYVPLRDVAVGYGAPVNLAFLWPLLIDGALVIFYLALVRASILNESTWWFWCLIGIATVSTIFFNLVHADQNIVSVGVAIAPPVILFFSTETLVRMLQSQAQRLDLSASLAATRQKLADLRANLKTEQVKLDNELAAYRTQIETERTQLATDLDSLRTQIETERQELETVQGHIATAKIRMQDIIGDTLLIWSDNGPLNPAEVGPEIRQALLIEWASRGQSRDTIRDIYPDIFGKTAKTFDRDVAGCNGQLEQYWT